MGLARIVRTFEAYFFANSLATDLKKELLSLFFQELVETLRSESDKGELSLVRHYKHDLKTGIQRRSEHRISLYSNAQRAGIDHYPKSRIDLKFGCKLV